MEDSDASPGRRPGQWSAVTALYVALVVVKPLYIGIVAIIPYFVRWYLNLYQELLGVRIGDYSVSRIWLAGFVLLSVLTSLLAAQYAREAMRAMTTMDKAQAARLAFRKLTLSWVLLDSISFYGVASKALRYSDFWSYGFVAVSTLLTLAAGWPLLALWREKAK